MIKYMYSDNSITKSDPGFTFYFVSIDICDIRLNYNAKIKTKLWSLQELCVNRVCVNELPPCINILVSPLPHHTVCTANLDIPSLNAFHFISFFHNNHLKFTNIYPLVSKTVV